MFLVLESQINALDGLFRFDALSKEGIKEGADFFPELFLKPFRPREKRRPRPPPQGRERRRLFVLGLPQKAQDQVAEEIRDRNAITVRAILKAIRQRTVKAQADFLRLEK
ncbi:hypothetical protein [Geobacter anodireducens]